jgi:catechol 2,3-dioxygenase-like lactoylglutathione lyase family enzyme
LKREPPARPKTGHVGLNVINLRKSTAFYRSIFEFEVIEEVSVGARQFVFLGYDGDTVLTPGNRVPTASAQIARALIT